MTELPAAGAFVAATTARRAVRSGAGWGVVFGAYVASSALTYTSAYKTAAQRSHLVTAFGANPGISALIGPATDIGTVAGFTAWRTTGVLDVVGAVWGLLIGTRLLRGEEEAGRWDLLLTGPTTRRGATVQALGGLTAGVAAMWAVTAGIAVAVGRLVSPGFSVASCLYLALALVCTAAVWAAAGALTSQIVASRRRAAGWAAVVLAVAYGLRLVADSGIGVPWLRWASPLGWSEMLHPLTRPRPLLLVPLAVMAAVSAVAAARLAAGRDVGSSVRPERASSPADMRLLGGPGAFAVRQVGATAFAWCTASGLTALAMGLIAKSVGAAVSADAGERAVLDRLGYSGGGAKVYLAVAFLLLATLAMVAAAGYALRWRDEEVSGRLAQVLAGPVSRTRWLTSHLWAAVAAVGAMAAAGAIGAAIGTAATSAAVGWATIFDAAANTLPPALFVMGVGVFVFGAWPRAAPLTYGVLAWSLLVQLLGAVSTFPHWLLDTSLLHHMAGAPAAPPDWAANAAMLAIAVVGALLGGAAFAHRDVSGA